MMFKADPTKIGPFTKGVNNRLPSSALGKDQLRNAVNVDIDNSGRLHRRAGAVKAVAGTSVRSVWFDGETGRGYFADGTALKSFAATGTAPYPAEQVATVTAGAPVAFARRADSVFWTDGILTGQLVGSSNRAWGIAVPPAAPTLVQAAGNLFDGQYQCTYTYVRANGEESGAPMTNQITISHSDRTQDGTAAIRATGIVASSDPTVVAINVYCTGANGTEPLRVATTANVSGQVLITDVNAEAGQTLATQFVRPPPAGSALFTHGARVYIVSGNVLYYSDRFAPGWFSPAFNFLPFPAPIAVALPVKNGVFVATTEATYFLPGMDPEKMSLDVVLPYGALPGSGASILNDLTVAWIGRRGLVIGKQGGVVEPQQEDQVAIEQADAGVTGYREVNGMRQLVAVLRNAVPSPMANKDFTEQEARRVITQLPGN
jgi:hypothetical protein